MRHEPRLGQPGALRSPATLQTTLSRELQALLRTAQHDAIVARLTAAGMESLVERIAHTPALARYLAKTPELVDRLIDGGAYAPLPSPAQLAAEFAALLEQGGQPRAIAAIRDYRFRLDLQLIEGAGDPLDIAMAHCNLAEAGMRAIADDALSRMKEMHGEVPGAELVILALGRFGGRAISSTSDLDIIYLFTGDCRAQSDGRKPLDADEYFSRVAQQITMAMSTVTPLGPLYEVDARLRPWGAKGMLACSTETYRRYHGENARTWEHMALTRARPVYGSAAARREVNAIVGERLRAPRDRAALLHDAIKMRGDIARHKPARGPFDVKLVDGGLVDLEFAIHVNQLAEHVGIGPGLEAAIRSQVSAGLIGSAVIDAHQVLSRMLIALRLLSPDGHEPAPEQRGMVTRACGFDDWDELTTAYAEARQSVGDAWRQTMVQLGEDPRPEE
jgi:[glutamine synthetase] adenylyltransferase / [glutamine synthetase]-adenylyl-L-tyrosine phosphorylase